MAVRDTGYRECALFAQTPQEPNPLFAYSSHRYASQPRIVDLRITYTLVHAKMEIIIGNHTAWSWSKKCLNTALSSTTGFFAVGGVLSAESPGSDCTDNVGAAVFCVCVCAGGSMFRMCACSIREVTSTFSSHSSAHVCSHHIQTRILTETLP